jgi:hypothetical protein
LPERYRIIELVQQTLIFNAPLYDALNVHADEYAPYLYAYGYEYAQGY